MSEADSLISELLAELTLLCRQAQRHPPLDVMHRARAYLAASAEESNVLTQSVNYSVIAPPGHQWTFTQQDDGSTIAQLNPETTGN